jgi:hypothetical protein
MTQDTQRNANLYFRRKIQRRVLLAVWITRRPVSDAMGIIAGS